MRSGSNGGPWIQNFNRKSRGQRGGRNMARAAVVGVTSFTTELKGPRILGASMLDGYFRRLLEWACAEQSGNC